MKIIAIGDTHGRSLWKDITTKEKDTDKIVFIGDYFDTHGGGYSANRQIENFKEILEYKKANMDKVVLLIGNHDFHYLSQVSENYSGYQWHYVKDINDVLQPAVDGGLLQMCFVHDKYVFTHAGVTKTWCQNSGVDVTNLQDSINQLFKDDVSKFKFTMGGNFSNTGNDVTQPPIWVRLDSLAYDIIDDSVCVVGHTTMNKMDLSVVDKYKIIMIDTVGTSQEYLIVNDLVPEIGHIVLS